MNLQLLYISYAKKPPYFMCSFGIINPEKNSPEAVRK